MPPIMQCLSGPAAEPFRDDLAALRIRVFREYPYLYAGSLEYERHYLQTYLECPDSLLIVVEDDGQVVGCSTALPLAEAAPEFSRPFAESDIDPDGVFYFGESVLLPEYRGRGIGHAFFDQREAFALGMGRFRLTAFCAIDRPPDHPRRPPDYQPLDPFWEKRGYRRQPHLFARFSWKEVDELAETAKQLTFWTRELPA